MGSKDINILINSNGRILRTDCTNRNYCEELMNKFNVVKAITSLKNKINSNIIFNDFLIIDERIIDEDRYYFIKILNNNCYLQTNI